MNNLMYKLYRKKTIERIEKKNELLGDRYEIKASTFLNTRLFLTIIIFLLFLFCFKGGYILAPIMAALFYMFYEKVTFDYRIKKRALKLEHEAIFFFEVVNLTLESNRNLKKALELTANNVDSELSEEFKKTFTEMKMGKSFTESLLAMKERIPSDTINSILLNITESSIFGNSIINTINDQIDYLREKRILRIKGEINKLPTKISIISVLFFIPIMLLIILAPVLLKLIVH